MNKREVVKWRFAILFLVVIPVVVHTLLVGAYKFEYGGTFWIGPISTTVPYLFLMLLFLAHCFDLKSESRRPAYWGAVMAWFAMMAFTVFIAFQTPVKMTSTTPIAMGMTPFCYIPFLALPYIIGAIAGKIRVRWKG